MGLLLGLLVGVVGLILYEQTKNKPTATAAAAAPRPAVTSGGGGSTSGPQPSNPIASSPTLTNTNPGVDNSILLPQFDSANQSSIIDLSQQPALTPNGWNCQNGSIPYYDPRTQLVYCVLPGMNPQSSSEPNVSTPWYETWSNDILGNFP